VHMFPFYDVYSKGSTSISSAEQGLDNSNLPSTLGCSIPREPMTMSLLAGEWVVGRAAFKFSARVWSGPEEV